MRSSPPGTNFQPACGCGVCPHSVTANTEIIISKLPGLCMRTCLLTPRSDGGRQSESSLRPASLHQWEDTMRKLIRIAVALMATIPAVSGRVNVARVPLSFEANQGQTDSAVKFLSRGDGYALFLTPAEAVFKLGMATPSDKEPAVLRMR